LHDEVSTLLLKTIHWLGYFIHTLHGESFNDGRGQAPPLRRSMKATKPRRQTKPTTGFLQKEEGEKSGVANEE
jgi:hypothetical protein